MSDEIELPEPMAYLNTDCIGERYLCFSAPTGGVTENLYTADQLRAAIEADRKRRGEPVAWPLASPEDADKGWTLDYRFIEQVERIASQHTDYTTSMEATEQVLIAANEVLRASQPAEQQPVEGEENRMNTHDIELPPLPTGYKSYEFPDGGYDADEMQAYARAAIEAHRKQQPDVSALEETLERIASWPDGGNLSGQPHIKMFAAKTLAAYRKQEPSHDNQ